MLTHGLPLAVEKYEERVTMFLRGWLDAPPKKVNAGGDNEDGGDKAKEELAGRGGCGVALPLLGG